MITTVHAVMLTKREGGTLWETPFQLAQRSLGSFNFLYENFNKSQCKEKQHKEKKVVLYHLPNSQQDEGSDGELASF